MGRVNNNFKRSRLVQDPNFMNPDQVQFAAQHHMMSYMSHIV